MSRVRVRVLHVMRTDAPVLFLVNGTLGFWLVWRFVSRVMWMEFAAAVNLCAQMLETPEFPVLDLWPKKITNSGSYMQAQCLPGADGRLLFDACATATASCFGGFGDGV